MPLFNWSGQGADQQGASPGWSLNPIADAQKATSGIGDWINQHTAIGGFNPGIGSAVSTIGGIVPGLVNLGISAATPWNPTSQNRLEQAATGFGHGLADTATDVATVGGLAPYTKSFEGMAHDEIGYSPSSLKQYATEKGGPGLLGAGLNDFANLAMGSGIYAKSAAAGELGEAATAAQAADKAAQLAHAAQGGLPGDVAAAGSAAREAAAADAASSSNFEPEDVLQRAKLLDRLHTVQQGVDYAFNPLRAWQALGAPLGRAAVLDAVPEAGIDTQSGRIAQAEGETPQTATQGVSEHPPVQASQVPEAAPQVAPAPDPLQDLIRASSEAASQAEQAGGGAPGGLTSEPAPGMVRLYRGQVVDPNVPVGTDSWTSTLPEAQSHAAASGGQVIATDVPMAVADQAHAAAQAAGDFGTSDTVHHIPAEYADAALPVTSAAPAATAVTQAPAAQAAPAAVTTLAPPEPAPVEPATTRARDLGPQEKQINLARAKRTPDWATKIVDRLPEPAKKLLRSMEYRAQGHQTATVIQEAGRTLRMQQAAEFKEPWFKAHVALAQDLVTKALASEDAPKIDLDQADRIVGERVHAALTAGPAWHAMEELRPQLDAIEPQAVEKAFGFRGRMPGELNTTDFRNQVQGVADLLSQHLEGRAEFAASSPYLADRGLENVDQTGPRLTSDQEAMLKKAVKAKLDAIDLAPEARAQAEAAVEQIAQHEATAAGAYDNITSAKQAAAAALERLTEQRFGSRIVESPNGDIVPGDQIPGNMTEKQMAATGTGREGDTPQQAYQRGLKARVALEDYQKAQTSEREAYATLLQAHRSVLDLQDQLANASLPAQMGAAALHGKSETLLTRLQDQLNNASVSRVPPVYQPITRAALEIARMAKEHPELADVLAEVPKNFADAVKYSHDQGFDPTHVSEMTEEKARRFAMGTSILSPDLGKQEIGLFRKQRTGALASAGLDSRTAAGMAAQWASVWHEDRVNAIADTVDRLYAVPAPKNEFGETYNPNPKEFTWWDQKRRGLLSTSRPESGIEQGIQGTQLIPKSVARTIDAYSKDHSNMLQRALAKTTDPWRALVLTASPKFYVNHMVGHVILGAVQGVSLKQWAEAWNEAKGGFANYPELTKQGIYERESGMPSSMIPFADMSQARATDGFVGAVREGQQKLNNAVNTVDAFAKTALALKGQAAGLSREDSLHFAQQAGVDYSALSPFERQVVRSVIPFYSFEKGVLKIVMQYPLDHPVAANVLMQTGRLQQHWAVDSKGNPLPSAYQDMVKVPGIGNVNLKNLTPFKDVSSLVTPGGLVNSLQFAVKAGIETGLGVAPPGVKAGVKVGPTGNLVPDVPLLPTLANSLDATPQGALLSGIGENPAQAAESFAGLPTVKQSTVDNAGQRNAVSSGEAQLPLTNQQQATAFPVDSATLQAQLNTQITAAGGVLPSPLMAPSGTTPTPEQIGAATKTAVTNTKARAALTRSTKKAAQGIKITKPRKSALRQKVGRAHNTRSRSTVKRPRVPKP